MDIIKLTFDGLQILQSKPVIPVKAVQKQPAADTGKDFDLAENQNTLAKGKVYMRIHTERERNVFFIIMTCLVVIPFLTKGSAPSNFSFEDD